MLAHEFRGRIPERRNLPQPSFERKVYRNAEWKMNAEQTVVVSQFRGKPNTVTLSSRVKRGICTWFSNSVRTCRSLVAPLLGMTAEAK